MRNIFEVMSIDYIDGDLYDEIKFYDVYNNEEIITDIEYLINRPLTTADIIKFGSRSVFNYIDELLHELVYSEEIDEYTDNSYLSLMSELIKSDDYIEEFKEILAESIDFNEPNTQKFIKSLNLKCGIVGYSDWAFYLTYNDVDANFIEDLYNGYNFYTISRLNEVGSVIDSFSMVYLVNIQGFEDVLKEDFGVSPDDSVYIVNNEQAIFNELNKHFKLVDKVSYYRFKEVEELN